MSITLYSFVPQDRSGRIRWALEELSIPYELKILDYEKKEHKSAEYKKIHPMGFVPAYVEGDTKLFESGAVVMYLADKHRKAVSLAPEVDSPIRAEYLKWVCFAGATLDSKIVKVFDFQKLTDEKEKAEKMDELYEELVTLFAVMDSILAKNKFILGNDFSAADLMLAQPLQWAVESGLLKKHNIIENYFNELKNRPAAIRSLIFSPEN